MSASIHYLRLPLRPAEAIDAGAGAERAREGIAKPPPKHRGGGSLRPLVEACAADAEAERRHDRSRKRRRGDRSRSFWDDPDRFALAAAIAIQMTGDRAPVVFGGNRSDWSVARHAAALVAPGHGQRVGYQHHVASGALIATPAFATGAAGHDTAARRLARKRRALVGVPEIWVHLSGCFLMHLNSPARAGARAHARAMLGVLGWDRLPLSFWSQLRKLTHPNNINALRDLKAKDMP